MFISFSFFLLNIQKFLEIEFPSVRMDAVGCVVDCIPQKGSDACPELFRVLFI